ncbi:acetoacetate decarboxylase [Amycolatopsis acidicola]|uniref:Acetoacetate decarboxylase n=1 Tax=Amycolatopsis acidicola TaxID=2596893 RepID=A0A5N0VGX9_9PSEU|nr:acetoacetate decarboxylase family protein [Amycolatopsis acidicola]KAA9164400.1 acetoacetate decarboxylase [Amycolatopsis acidicola]
MTPYMTRMPLGFGPANGPRHVPDRQSGENRRIRLEVTARVDGLEPLLAEDMALPADPVVVVEAHYLSDLRWLAGRGYNIVRVRVPVLVGGRAFDYLPVLWENLPDAIMTGREELGYPKLYAEIPGHTHTGGASRGSASWDGFTFVDLAVRDLVETSPGERNPHTPRPEGVLVRKYIPRTGGAGADADYVTMTPAGAQPPVVERAWTGSGRFAFHSATFAQLPTLHHVVNRLAALDVREFVDARILHTRGDGDLSAQCIVDGGPA